MVIVCSFYCYLIFHGMDIPQFIEQFTYWKTSELFSVDGYCEYNCYECFLCELVFIYGSGLFNFTRNAKLFSRVALLSHITLPQKVYKWSSFFLNPLQHLKKIVALEMGMQSYDTVVLFFIWLMVMLNISLCAYLSSA